DFRTDQFSLGTILYEMTTGKQPFLRETAVQTMSAVIEFTPAPTSETNPRIPPGLENIITRCLNKSPVQRYELTRTLADELRNQSDQFKTTPISPSIQLQRVLRRKRRTVAGVAAAIGILLVAFVFRHD